MRPPETKEVQLPQPFCCCCLVFAWTTKPLPSPTYLLSQMNSSLYRYHKTRRTSSHCVFDLFYQPVTLPKVMTRMCFLLSLSQHHSPVTPVTTLCAEAREAAQKLLNHYVKVGFLSTTFKSHKSETTFLFSCFIFVLLQVQGLIISQMLRKSVETRDWVNTIEPRNVRAVMKRVVEDTTSIDVQVRVFATVPMSSCTHDPS